MLKAAKSTASDTVLLDTRSTQWSKTKPYNIKLFPAPVQLARELSPFMALREDHGSVTELSVQALHNQSTLNVRLVWKNAAENDRIDDLDQFTDGAAIMFALSEQTSAMSMGSLEHPANGWYWKADFLEPFDILFHGFGTSERRTAAFSQLKVNSHYQDGHWMLVLQRPLAAPKNSCAGLAPGTQAGISFAIWDGGNKERAGEKAISGDFMPFQIEQ